MKHCLVIAVTGLSAGAFGVESTRQGERLAVTGNVVAPTRAQLNAAASQLPRCALPTVPDGAWPRHQLRAGLVALRLPPRYTPEAAEGLLGATMKSWASPDSGWVSVMLDQGTEGTFVLQPDAPLLGQPTACALPMLGHLAHVTRSTYGGAGDRDTLHVVTIDAPATERMNLGAGAMHPRRASLDTLLAALATLEVSPSPSRPP